MVNAIKKLVLRLLPEVNSGYHLPRHGRVVGIADPPNNSYCDEFRPYYAVDIQVLDEQGEPDDGLPIFPAVPLPVESLGNEQGRYGFPEIGALVIVCFAYGLPNKPYIQQLLPNGTSLPSFEDGEQLWQHNNNSQQRATRDGSWHRKTNEIIIDESVQHITDALEKIERYQRHIFDVVEHSTENIGGSKVIEALGRVSVLSGGHLNIGSSGNLNLTTATDINTTSGRNVFEAIEGIHRSVAKLNQHIEVKDGGKLWLGSESVNTLALLSDLMGIVKQLASDLASHKHLGVQTGSGQSGLPVTATNFTSLSDDTDSVKTQLDPLLE